MSAKSILSFRTLALCLILCLVSILGFSATATRAEIVSDYFPFVYDTDDPEVLHHINEINMRTPVMFERALRAFPDVTTVSLSGDGGTVQAALAIAYSIRSAGLKTFIREGQHCHSSCAFLFFAGVERSAEGELGLHQLASKTNHLGAGQIVLADIVGALNDFDIPSTVLQLMLSTPADKMRIVTPAEMRSLGIIGVSATPRRDDSTPSSQVTAQAAWRQAFFLELKPGTVIADLLPCPARHCPFLIGTVADPDQGVSPAAWSLRNSDFFQRVGAGERLSIAGDLSDKIFGAVQSPRGTLVYDTNKASLVDFEINRSDALIAEPAELNDRDKPQYPPRALQFGILGASYSETLRLFVIGSMGELSFWELGYVSDRDGDGIRDLELGFTCSVSADGAVPWGTAQFSEDGQVMAVAHGAWTMALSMPDHSHPRDAWASKGAYCDGGDGGMESSSIHYMRFFDLSRSGRYIASESLDPSAGHTGPVDNALGIYDARWLVTAPNQRGGPPDPDADTSGLIARLTGVVGRISHAEFSDDGAEVLALTEIGNLRVWSLPDGGLIGGFPGLGGKQVDAARFAGNSGCIIASVKGGPAVLLDPGTGEIVQEFPEPSSRFRLLDGSQLLVTYSFGQRPARAYEASGYSCRR